MERVGDLASQAVVFSSAALIQFGNVAEYIGEKTQSAHLWLSVLGTTIWCVMFGIVVGRVLMPWQLRSIPAAVDAEGAHHDAFF